MTTELVRTHTCFFLLHSTNRANEQPSVPGPALWCDFTRLFLAVCLSCTGEGSGWPNDPMAASGGGVWYCSA